MPPEKENDPNILIEEDPTQPVPGSEQEPGVTVDLEKAEESQTPPKPDDLSVIKAELERERAEHAKAVARMEFQARQFEKTQKQVHEQMEKIKKVFVPEGSDKKDLDEVVISDWKKAVRELAKEEIEAGILAKQQQATEEARAQARIQELENSKKTVLEKHPEILDEKSEKYKLFTKIMQEDPSLLQNTRGPEITMYRMEERLKQGSQSELERFRRAAATSVPKGTTSDSKRVTLTREQEQFCKENGIPVEKYAKSLRALETGGITA